LLSCRGSEASRRYVWEQNQLEIFGGPDGFDGGKKSQSYDSIEESPRAGVGVGSVFSSQSSAGGVGAGGAGGGGGGGGGVGLRSAHVHASSSSANLDVDGSALVDPRVKL
jgi:hypothetical protein